MGRFSYDCSKCGSHDQFDYIDHCVIKIGDSLFVEGEYNEYGQVNVTVVDDNESSTKKQKVSIQGKGKGSAKGRMIEVQLEQFLEFFPSLDLQDDDLLATEIYCAGDKAAAEGSNNKPMKADTQYKQITLGRASMLSMMLGRGPAEYEERYCVPKGVTVKPHLLESELAGLPKALGGNGDDAAKKIKASSTSKNNKEGQENEKPAKKKASGKTA